MGNSARKQYELNTLKDLQNSGYGQPSPRHGLKLLFWLANEGVSLDRHDHITAQCDPRQGDYGFHHFGNFEVLLPVLPKGKGEKYFEVGNLNPETCPGAQHLPDYVREEYDRSNVSRDGNKDRIIIRLLPNNGITKIYVTEHCGWYRDFDAKRTYSVSRDLVRSIRDPDLELTTFLKRTGFYGKALSQRLVPVVIFIFVIVVICVLLWIFLK